MTGNPTSGRRFPGEARSVERRIAQARREAPAPEAQAERFRSCGVRLGSRRARPAGAAEPPASVWTEAGRRAGIPDINAHSGPLSPRPCRSRPSPSRSAASSRASASARGVPVGRHARRRRVGANDAGGVTIEVLDGRPSRGPSLRTCGPSSARSADHRRPLPEISGTVRPDFEIVAVGAVGRQGGLSIPADLATCPDCLRELADRQTGATGIPSPTAPTAARDHDRARHPVRPAQYHMAPVSDVPVVSRPSTTRPPDRRFHAQPNAWPGVRSASVADGGRTDANRDGPTRSGRRQTPSAAGRSSPSRAGRLPISPANATAACGRGVAGAPSAATRKPFAVMAADLAAAEAIAPPRRARNAISCSRSSAPSVLARRPPGAAVAPNVAPANPLVGIMLGPTPRCITCSRRPPLPAGDDLGQPL